MNGDSIVGSAVLGNRRGRARESAKMVSEELRELSKKLTYLSLDLFAMPSVVETFRSMSLKPGTDPAELIQESVLAELPNEEGTHLVPECSRFQEPLDLEEGN